MKRHSNNWWFRSSRRTVRGTRPGRSRRLRVEPLEQRALLAVVVVDNVGTTFDDAITQANADANIDTIEFEEGLGTIEIDGTVEYTGGQDLTIDGNGVTIGPSDGNEGAFDLFASTGDADLALQELTFQDGLDGIFVDVSAGATGVVSVTLEDVVVRDNAEFGLHVSDAGNSAAGISLAVSDSSFTGNGTGASDFDGIRVDETGAGDIIANVSNTQINANGGDGLELDERGDGDVVLTLSDSTLNDNGFFDPDDWDDGLDIDEAGAGDVRVSITNTTMNGNFDEGIDLDEEGDGSLIAELQNVVTNNNGDDGIKMSEEDGGSLNVELQNVVTNNNGGEGIQLEEDGDGSLDAQLDHVVANGNDKEGIQMEELGAGDVTATLENLQVHNNDNDGVEITEDGEGDLDVSVRRSMISGNAKFGLKVEQAGDGAGTLLLENVKAKKNKKGPLDTDGVVVTVVDD